MLLSTKMSPNWFVGFPVDSDSWYEKVITNSPDGIKCFNPIDLHITFAFFGAVGAENAQRAWFKAIEAGLQRATITLGAVAPFGDPEKPSAYAFTLNSGREEVVSYMERHRKGILDIVDRAPKYAPRPHLTIARPPRKASDALRAEGLAWIETIVAPEERLVLDKLALYTWADDRKKQQFKIVEAVDLAPHPE